MQYYDIAGTGLRIRKMRIHAEMTQEQLAQRLAIHFNHLSRIERGQCGISMDLAVAISQEFQISLDFLILGKENQTDLVKQKIYGLIGSLEEVAKTL